MGQSDTSVLPPTPTHDIQARDHLNCYVDVLIDRGKLLPNCPCVAVTTPPTLEWTGQRRVPLLVLPHNRARRPGQEGRQCQQSADNRQSPNQLPRPKHQEQKHERQRPNLDEDGHGQQNRGSPPALSNDRRHRQQDQGRYQRVALPRPDADGRTGERQHGKHAFAVRRPIARQHVAHQHVQRPNQQGDAGGHPDHHGQAAGQIGQRSEGHGEGRRVAIAIADAFRSIVGIERLIAPPMVRTGGDLRIDRVLVAKPRRFYAYRHGQTRPQRRRSAQMLTC